MQTVDIALMIIAIVIFLLVGPGLLYMIYSALVNEE